MGFDALADRLNKRLYRRQYRKMVKKWWEDGGDRRFRYDYPLDRSSFVMDLGGYQGQWASDLYSRHRCRISVFEPVERFAAALGERFENNEDIEVFQFGLGASSRSETIYIHGAGSSTYRKRTEAEKIRIVDIKQWFDDYGIDSVALMKINIEGGEYDLLDRMIDTGLIESIGNVQVQFHNFTVDATRRMEHVLKGLEKTHTPTYQYRFVWENWARNGNA